MVVTDEQTRTAVASAFRVGRPTRVDLLTAAIESGARPEIVGLLRSLPNGRFACSQDVWDALDDKGVPR